jgi:hypothetical protein
VTYQPHTFNVTGYSLGSDGWGLGVPKYRYQPPRPLGAVNLDAHIPCGRGTVILDDFRIFWSLDAAQLSDECFIGQFYKSHWGRPTWYWAPETIIHHISEFVDDKVAHPIVLCATGSQICVNDGNHRLSSLLAWMRDDYGDGEYSRRLGIPRETDLSAARECRERVNRTIGPFKKGIDGSLPVGWRTKYGVARPRAGTNPLTRALSAVLGAGRSYPSGV